jgi:hypothetical protein
MIEGMMRAVPRALLGALVLQAAVAALAPISAHAAEPRMQNRFDLLFRLGFGGSLVSDLGGVERSRLDADASPGGELRGDFPITRHITMGPLAAVYVARPDAAGFERNPVVDLAPFIKGRYNFRAGSKKAEIYGLFHVGMTMAFIRRSTRDSDRFGVGWNIGLTPGFQVLIKKHFGVVTELGWVRAQAFFPNAGNLILNQGIWRLGFVF